MEELRIERVPSSFLKNEKKLESEGGAGEAKLYVGHTSKESDYDTFFEINDNLVSDYKVQISIESLLKYHETVKLEYMHQLLARYKDVSLNKWKEIKDELEAILGTDTSFELLKYTDKARYYIRAKNREAIFNDILRKAIFPRITDIIIVKDDSKKELTLTFELNNNDPRDKTKKFISGLNLELPRNRIIFGAPGTGKSNKLEQEKEKLIGEDGIYERVTFHSEYSYSNFVGTYKPVPYINDKGEDSITYEYVPGPFMRLYVQAIRNNLSSDEKTPFLLIIEEINRANTASVFGDIFQLLDRKNGISEYPIQVSEDMKDYLYRELGGEIEDHSELRIPDNMYIWATMNSADQGVFPMDTAFKRRWDFEYLDIDDNEDKIEKYKINIKINGNDEIIPWNIIRKGINEYLTKEKVNEDKLLGPFFINVLRFSDENTEQIDQEIFNDVFKNKVIMYLFEDAAKHKKDIFRGNQLKYLRFSEICKEFDKTGLDIFHTDITTYINTYLTRQRP